MDIHTFKMQYPLVHVHFDPEHPFFLRKQKSPNPDFFCQARHVNLPEGRGQIIKIGYQ